MKIPSVPCPGMVVRYSFLFSRERDGGSEEGAKVRPALVLSSRPNANGVFETIVLPITHTPPHDPSEGIEIPPILRKQLNLEGKDGQRNWLKIAEANKFDWIGPDLQPVPGSKEQSVVYGVVPPNFFAKIKKSVLALNAERKVKLVQREDIDTKRPLQSRSMRSWSPAA